MYVAQVKHVIVCGHYDCGGVRAAMKNHDHGLIQNWIMGIKDVARLHREELRVSICPDNRASGSVVVQRSRRVFHIHVLKIRDNSLSRAF